MHNPSAQLTIGVLAERTGLNVSAIRYYEEIGLIPQAMCVFQASWTPSSTPLTWSSAPQSTNFTGHPVENSTRHHRLLEEAGDT